MPSNIGQVYVKILQQNEGEKTSKMGLFGTPMCYLSFPGPGRIRPKKHDIFKGNFPSLSQYKNWGKHPKRAKFRHARGEGAAFRPIVRAMRSTDDEDARFSCVSLGAEIWEGDERRNFDF